MNVSHAPGVNDFEVYHPRWSNGVRYMVMTGPYTSGDKTIKLWDRADGVEIYIGKFSKDFRKVDGWLKLTDSRVGEFFPDVWIAGGQLDRADSNPRQRFQRQRIRKWPKFSNQFSASPTTTFGQAAETDCCFNGATTRITVSSSTVLANRTMFA